MRRCFVYSLLLLAGFAMPAAAQSWVTYYAPVTTPVTTYYAPTTPFNAATPSTVYYAPPAPTGVYYGSTPVLTNTYRPLVGNITRVRYAPVTVTYPASPTTVYYRY